MARSLLGTDLRVVLGPPGLAAQDDGGLDLRRAESPRSGGTLDVAVIRERENLVQALILRVLTPQGSLAALGHGDYGCRLSELVGRGKTDSVRALAKGFVLAAVAQEPRVEDKAVAFAFDPASEDPWELRFTLTVRPRDGSGDLQLDLGVVL